MAEFDPAVPLDSAVTPPSGWYTDPAFLQLELDRVFLRGWQAVGTLDFPPSRFELRFHNPFAQKMDRLSGATSNLSVSFGILVGVLMAHSHQWMGVRA